MVDVRVARPDEADALGRIAIAAKASWGYAAAQLEAWRADLVPTAGSVSAQPTFVAEVAHEVAGFCQLGIAGARAELEHLWVHPRFMRQGVGRALLDRALRHLAQAGIAALDIDSDPNAEPFYVACGAVRVGTRAAPIDGEPDRTRPQLRLTF
jgi:ribosomal protein S18 acetylase RimI-like enzyme